MRVAAAPSDDEGLVDTANVQGNVFPGFHEAYLGLVALHTPRRGGTAALRALLRALDGEVTSAAVVLRAKASQRRAALRPKPQAPGRQSAPWLNVAFSAAALQRLGVPRSELRVHGAFHQGLWRRAALLGDRVDDDGRPIGWHLGHDAVSTPEVLLILSSDREEALDAGVARWCERGAAAGLRVGAVQRGAALPDDREPFGFRDNISQPGLRGHPVDAPRRWLTPPLRHGVASERGGRFGLPGQARVWPGQLLLGHREQSEHYLDAARPGFAPPPAHWCDGSFLVYRRLRQHPERLQRFLERGARQASRAGLRLTPEDLGALLVGRRTCGTPLSRVPLILRGAPEAGDSRGTLPKQPRSRLLQGKSGDISDVRKSTVSELYQKSRNQDKITVQDKYPDLGADPRANNAFLFASDFGDGVRAPADGYPVAPADPLGDVCPRAAHIRKVNPRDLATHAGGAAETLTHALWRRGSPFADRRGRGREVGLLFLAYQASIERSFEFITRNWMNDDSRPQPGGFDLLVGQNGRVGEGRLRTFELRAPGGAPIVLRTTDEWVVPTGGAYLFAPSLATLRDWLAGAERTAETPRER